MQFFPAGHVSTALEKVASFHIRYSINKSKVEISAETRDNTGRSPHFFPLFDKPTLFDAWEVVAQE